MRLPHRKPRATSNSRSCGTMCVLKKVVRSQFAFLSVEESAAD
jgi:hypothetical protein